MAWYAIHLRCTISGLWCMTPSPDLRRIPVRKSHFEAFPDNAGPSGSDWPLHSAYTGVLDGTSAGDPRPSSEAVTRKGARVRVDTSDRWWK